MRATTEHLLQFWARVLPNENGCWIWMGTRNRAGYGQFSSRGLCSNLAHRFAVEIVACRAVPDGLILDHLCRTPSCVNPDHLEVVTTRVNNLRGFGWSGRNASRTHCPSGHPYSADNLTRRGSGIRECRECAREARRKWNAKNPQRSRGPIGRKRRGRDATE